MAIEISNYLSLNQVVKSYMNEKNEQGLVNFERYLQIAIEGFSEINIFNINSVEVAYIAVDPDTKIARLPADFIQLSKIGVNVCGRFWCYTLNNDIVLPRPETICAATIETCNDCVDITTDGYFFAPHWYAGNYISALYGLGGGFNSAYYKIDKSNNRILFQGCMPNEIILEYISSGVKSGGSPIPRQAAQALKAYLHWKTMVYDTRYSLSDKMYMERLYNQELLSLNFIENSFTYSEYLDTYFSTLSQSIKR